MKFVARIAGFTCVFALMALGFSHAAPLTVAADNIDSGPIVLAAPETAAAGDDLLVIGGVTVASTGGNVTLSVGDNLTLAPGSTVAAAGVLTIVLDDGNADPGVGSIATLAGQLTGNPVTIVGGPDSDLLVYLGPDALLTFLGPNAGTISAPGRSTITFSSIENFQGNVAVAPEPGSLLLIATAGVGGLVGRLRRRRSV